MKNIKNIILAISLALPITFSFNINYVKSAEKNDLVEKVGSIGQVDWGKNVIKVTGTGAAPDKGSQGQKRAMAIRAAKLDAYRQLVEMVNGIHVSSETIVKDFVTESDTIKTKVEGILKGFEQVGEPRYMSDGSVEVDVQVKLFGETSVASAIMPSEIKKIETDSKPDTKLTPAEIEEDYTSVILDCQNIGAKPSMSPSIQDSDGGEVYIGNLPIDPDFVVNQGIVSYANTIADAKKIDRVGKNPLVIKALKAKGNFKSDIVISNDDAKKLMGANNKSNFLKNFKVIMVI